MLPAAWPSGSLAPLMWKCFHGVAAGAFASDVYVPYTVLSSAAARWLPVPCRASETLVLADGAERPPAAPPAAVAPLLLLLGMRSPASGPLGSVAVRSRPAGYSTRYRDRLLITRGAALPALMRSICSMMATLTGMKELKTGRARKDRGGSPCAASPVSSCSRTTMSEWLMLCTSSSTLGCSSIGSAEPPGAAFAAASLLGRVLLAQARPTAAPPLRPERPESSRLAMTAAQSNLSA